MGHADASAEGDLALGLDSMELGEDAASVGRECGQHFTVTVRAKHFSELRPHSLPTTPIHLFFGGIFPDRVSPCSPGCPGTCSADQAGLKLRDCPASASPVQGLKTCIAMPS